MKGLIVSRDFVLWFIMELDFQPYLFVIFTSSNFHHPLDAVIAELVVKYKGLEVHNLNELEYINNEVWANIWQVYF